MKALLSGLLLVVALAGAIGGGPREQPTAAVDLVLPGSDQRLRLQFAVEPVLLDSHKRVFPFAPETFVTSPPLAVRTR